MAIFLPFKDPDEVLDYQIDWSARLVDDTISTSSWILQSGITKNSDSKTSTTTTIWLSGGTIEVKYTLLNRIITVGGRTMDQTFEIYIMAR